MHSKKSGDASLVIVGVIQSSNQASVELDTAENAEHSTEERNIVEISTVPPDNVGHFQ